MTGYIYPVPAWRVTLAGEDISARFAPRLISLSITECRGGEADKLDITLDDHDGRLQVPARNARLRVLLGWQDTGLIDKGTFLVDEVEYSGPPDQITLRARSADLTSPLRTRNDRSFHKTTIGEIVQTIGKAHGLEPVVGSGMKAVKIAHIDQTNESDVAFLNRIGKRYDAVATIKDGKLLLVPIERGRTATGQEMPTLTLSRGDGDEFRFHVSNRDTYTGVRAFWQDKTGGKRRSVLAGVVGNAKRMRELFASEQDALDNARAEWQRLQRGIATLTFNLAYGRPDLAPQTKVIFPTMKAPMGEITWLISQATHKLEGSGLTTSFEAETIESAQERDDQEADHGDVPESEGDPA
ncbi:contractile injection system protein, VgrG/Pvc8 family [Achromobacter sp. UMC71]|uniref:contractile injection system protein, VgrG/Pvc8 family n=1 Tax=Achromobacter sp. UMC71 TaxID=1862320 RepID=UPI00351C7C30